MQVLIEIQPLNLSTGARETVRVASAQDRRITGLNSAVWVPALLQPPVLTIRLFDGDFSSSIDPGSATFTIALDEVGKTYPNAYAYLWAGAPVSIYAEEPGTAWPWTRRFVGKVRRFEKAAKRIQMVAEVDTAALEKDVLYLKYAGTTGIEGGADLKDRVRPWVWGHVKGIEPVQIDIDNSVFQVSGYGAIGGIPAVYERGSSFGDSMGDHADYAALVAATIPPGRWATCLAQGLFRLGAPPFGIITADVQGHKVSGSVPRRTGFIIRAMAAALGISSDSIDAASLDALDAAVPRNINVYLTEQEKFIDLAQRLCLPCNAYSGVSWTGKFFAVRPVFGSAALTLHGQGRADPQVVEMVEGGVNPPFKKTIFGADRCWRVHTTTDIAYQDILIDRGRYQAGETYRAGNIVDLADGSRWLYTADTASAGNAPVDGSAFWTLISDQVQPVYLDGTTMEALKPAEPGATEGAIIPVPGSGQPGNVKDGAGNLRPPGELLNSSIELEAAGRLLYRPLPDAPAVIIGRVTPQGLSVVTEAAFRRAEDDIEQLGRALATALDEASLTRATFRDAGFYVDAATGQVRIHAIEQTRERVSTAEIRLDAAEANINLRATTSYVNEAIALAVIDPSQIAELTDIFLRLGAAEVDIDGLNATVTTLATVTELSLVQGRVTTAEEAIDALEGTITTKVDTTTFDLLATRVTNAETVLTAIGDTATIVNAVSATRLIEKAQDGNVEADLRALLLGDRAMREQVAAVAAARQELTARIIDGEVAEAALRLALQVQVSENSASLAAESLVRASEDAALATQITSLSASTTTSINSLATTIANESSARATAINNEADARIAAINAEAAARGTAITAEETARIAAINAERTQTLADVAAEAAARAAAVSTLNAAITSEQTARTNADTALATDITNLSASLTSNVATLQTNINNANQARIDGDGALAASISSLSAELDTEVSNRAAAVESEAQARVAADGLIAAGLAQQVTAGRVVEGQASELADLLLGALLNNDKNRREINGAVAGARQEITAQIVSEVEALSTRILALVARVAGNEASIVEESIARVTAVESLASTITSLNASFTGQLSAEATARTNAIAAEATTRAAAISAESTARTNSVNTLTSGLNNALGRLDDEELARLQGDQAEATARAAALTAEANARIAAINAEAAARGTALTAEENARIAAINAEIAAREAAVTTLTASINNEAIARANADGALAGQISTLNTTVAGQSATLVTFGESINGLRARWGAKVDVNGRVGGFVLNGTSEDIDATFVVDNFSVVDPDTGVAFLDADADGLRLQNGKVIMNNGTNMLVMGAGFGVDNQFVMWFGPSRAISACNEADALFFLDVTGDGEYGLRLGSNYFKNSGTGTSTASNAQIVVGPFTTEGGSKQINVGFQYRRLVQITDAFAYTGTPQAVLRVERQVGSGSFTTVGDYTFNGTASGEDGFGPAEPGSALIQINGNASFTDSTGGTGDFTYRVSLISRSVGGLTSTVSLEDSLAQTITLISTEQIT